jgi:hypothetical protein
MARSPVRPMRTRPERTVVVDPAWHQTRADMNGNTPPAQATPRVRVADPAWLEKMKGMKGKRTIPAWAEQRFKFT